MLMRPAPCAHIAPQSRLLRPNEAHLHVSRLLEPGFEKPGNVEVRLVGAKEAALWSDVSARGWTHEHPEFEPFVRQMGALCVARENCPCFLAEVDGNPGSAGVLCLHEGVALFGGSATVPELRRKGLQGALLAERMRYAVEHGYDLAMMVAEAGSNSQRNAERKGFRVTYTRLKWRLSVPGAASGEGNQELLLARAEQ